MTGIAAARRASTTLGYLPALDGIRAVAVLAVMGYHAGLPGFAGGSAGVDVFFVISGFLISTLLLEEWAARGTVQLRAFYVRRALRLLPALLTAIAVALALAALKILVFDASSESLQATVEGTPFALLYTMNFARALDWTEGGFLGHTWSLSIEEQFYLLWPLVVIALVARTTPRNLSAVGRLALVAALASAAGRAVASGFGVSDAFLYDFTVTHVDGILAGCALAVFWRLGSSIVVALGRPSLLGASLVLAVSVVAVGRSMIVLGYVTIVLCTVVAISTLLRDRAGWFAAVMSAAPLVWVGRRSYGLYLYHWPIFLFIGIDTRPHIVVAAFGASFALAAASYRFVERPALALKRRWAAVPVAV
jgi:peptidoglycan/LPS O-acetylase OafA/YrhL